MTQRPVVIWNVKIKMKKRMSEINISSVPFHLGNTNYCSRFYHRILLTYFYLSALTAMIRRWIYAFKNKYFRLYARILINKITNPNFVAFVLYVSGKCDDLVNCSNFLLIIIENYNNLNRKTLKFPIRSSVELQQV